MSVYVPSLKEIDREQDLLNDGVYRAYRPTLLRFVTQLQLARSDTQLMDLQLALLGQVKAHQELIRKLRAEIKALQVERSVEVERRPKNVQRLSEIHMGLARLEFQEHLQEALRWLLLNVGDGIVWKRTGYDRAAITVLGQGPRVAWLSEAEGLSAELGALEHQWRNGHFSVLTDVTTCIRHGDLLTFEPERIVLYEVKATRTAGAASPQMTRLAEATKFLNTGESVVDGKRRAIVRTVTPYRTFLDILGPLLDEAERKGEAWRHPSPAQFVVAHDVRHFRKDNGRVPARIDDRIKWASGFPEEDLVLGYGSAVRRMQNRRHSFATLAPLSIFPLSAAHICDLLLGFLVFTTAVNISAVTRRMESAGYDVTPYGPPQSADAFMTLKRRVGSHELTFTVAPHFREMMMLELMTPANVQAAADGLVEAMLVEKVADSGHLMVMNDEARVWTRRA